MEVVAALAIMGALLVSVVMAQGRHVRQLAQGRAKLAAVQAADDLLTQWWAGAASATATGPVIPIDSSGELANLPPFRWQTETVQPTDVEAFGGQIVRLTIWPLEHEAAEPLVTVDLAVALPAQTDLAEEDR